MRILIANVHSALNLGDDAIMRVTLAGLRERFPGARITVAANDPASWRGYADQAEVVGSLTTWVAGLHGAGAGARWRSRPGPLLLTPLLLALAALSFRLARRRLAFGGPEQRRLLAAYADADLVLSCGGGNFYANRALSPLFVWALLALAYPLALGKRVVMLPQSVGPIAGRLQRLLARLVFARVERVMLREARSAEYLARTLGVRQPPVVLPDLAFGLAADRTVVGATSRVAGRSSGGPRVGVTVLDWGAQARSFGGQAAYEDALANLLARLAAERGASVEVFCQCSGPSADQDDRRAARRLAERLRGRVPAVALRADFADARELLAAYAELDLLIGTRLHTAVFGLTCGVPVLLIGYQPKAAGTLELLGLARYGCDIAAVSEGELYSRAAELLASGPDLGLAGHVAARLAAQQPRGWLDYLEG